MVTFPKRVMVADTDTGERLKEQIADLEDLLTAYREGLDCSQSRTISIVYNKKRGAETVCTVSAPLCVYKREKKSSYPNCLTRYPCPARSRQRMEGRGIPLKVLVLTMVYSAMSSNTKRFPGQSGWSKE